MRLQAFIFCGQGGNLAPIVETDQSVNNGLPKALALVGNRPMIEYVLDWCDQADFGEINVVASAEEIDIIREGLMQYLTLRDQHYQLVSAAIAHLRKPRPINFIPSKCNNTGEKLQKELLHRITGDFVLLPCDFVTDMPPQILLDQFSNKDQENLALAVLYKNNFENIEKKPLGKQFYTIYSENNDTNKKPVLLDVYAKDDVEKNKYLQIRNHMLWRFPDATVSTKLLNSFIYFCSYELAKLLKEDTEKSLESSIETPHDDDLSIQPTDLTAIKTKYFRKDIKLVKDNVNCNKSLAKVFRDLARRSWKHSEPRNTVGIFILPKVISFIRANNLGCYMEANRFILKIKAQTANKHGQTTQPSSSAAIGADSILGPNCVILEKSNVKMSAIGPNCNIGNRCRVAGSILLANVKLEDDVILENVIIGANAIVQKKSKLTNCYVQGSYIVAAKSVLKGETLSSLMLSSDEEGSKDTQSSSSESDSQESDEYYEEDEEDDGLFDR